MAGTVTKYEAFEADANGVIPSMGRMCRVRWDWTSDASGNVTDATNGTTAKKYAGWITGVWTLPGSSAPTALYDVTILDEDAMDVLEGGGADRSATLKERVSMVLPMPLAELTTLKLAVANAGNAKTGSVILSILLPPMS